MVEHDILLTKFEHYGIRGLGNGWFKFYLTGNNFFSINSHDSSFCFVWCNQSSALSLFFFFGYMSMT